MGLEQKVQSASVTFETAVEGLTSLVRYDASLRDPVLIPPSPPEVCSALDSLSQALKRENGNPFRYLFPYQPKKEQLKTIRDAINHVVAGISKTTTSRTDFLNGDDNRVAASLFAFMETTDDGEQYGLQETVRPLFSFMLRHTKEPDKSARLAEIIQLLSPKNAILVLDEHSLNPDLDRRVDGDFPALRRSSQILDMLSESFTRHPRETKSLQEDRLAPFVLNEALNRITGYNVSNEAFNADFAQSWATAIAKLIKTHPQIADLPLIREYFLAGTAKRLLRAKNDGIFQTTMTGIIPRLSPAGAVEVLHEYLSVDRAQPEVRTAGSQAETADEFVKTQAYRRYMQAFDALGMSFGNRYPGKRSVKLTQKEIDELSWFSRTVNTSILIMTSHEPPFRYRDQMRAGVAAKYNDLIRKYPYLTPYLQLK